MSVIVEITVPAADFELGRSLQTTDNGARFELERMIPTTDRVIPYFWAKDTDFTALTASLSDDENVLGLTLLDDFDDRALFRIEWPSDINGLVGSIKAHGATIIDAAGTNERWEFQLRFPDSADISGFHADCKRRGIHLNLRRLYRPEQSDLETSGLTPTQRETLLTALEEGYFSIPRRITGEELAEKLGVSDQAVSERLRRAQTTVFTSLLLANDTNADDD